ncbi:hypothetical protein ANCCAN_09921 [Ancylostoma caninum]|uniref:Uncharacterized protein n=1 Tax=Ancylostoma caninum TaxID=29170 RepID=A0A368GK57_ANCCA|nr:hypothetical protein ANCCAN_09921 [Ancylostoma caninum]
MARRRTRRRVRRNKSRTIEEGSRKVVRKRTGQTVEEEASVQQK